MDDYTRKFSIVDDKDVEIYNILTTVYQALEEKGYNPINQIVCKLPKYLEKPLFWTDGKDCRHSNVDKLDKRCYNLVTIFPRECLHV